LAGIAPRFASCSARCFVSSLFVSSLCVAEGT
jgi:hypothetical protein